MGIVNTTPDSFSDGGRYLNERDACRHCEVLLRDGADLLDIGAESTRPGAPAVPVEEELRRLLPVVRFAVTLGVPVSVDTWKPLVMQAALDAGADVVNDVQALRADGAMDVVAAHPSCGVCLMHMQGDPQTMQREPAYHDVVAEVTGFLEQRFRAVVSAGVAEERVVLDPGIGFGKSVAHNFALLQSQSRLMQLNRPILAGWSRKSSIGAITGRSVEQRLAGSLAAALAALARGASIVRVHDVAETVDAIKIWRAAGLLGN